MNKFELETMFLIRKLKVQLYFKEKFHENFSNVQKGKSEILVKNSKSNKKENHLIISNKEKVKKPKPAKKLKPSVIRKEFTVLDANNLIGKKLRFIANESRSSLNSLISLIKRFKSEEIINGSTKVTKELYDQIADVINENYYNYQYRLINTKASKEINYKKKALKFKPSYGRPGNYGKLIYTKPKS